MRKPGGETKRAKSRTRTTGVTAATTADAVEPRVVAFAAQLGRIAGTIHGKAGSWMDREMLRNQIASVRDGAAHLLEELAGGGIKTSRKRPLAAAARGGSKGRSGGVVDAPGKKHRKPAPRDPDANIAASQTAKMRTARTMVKTNRRRGRG
jgi:hypothetical protein